MEATNDQHSSEEPESEISSDEEAESEEWTGSSTINDFLAETESAENSPIEEPASTAKKQSHNFGYMVVILHHSMASSMSRKR